MSLADCSSRNTESEAREWDLWSEAGSVRATNDEVAFKMIYASIPTGDFFMFALECELSAACSAHIYTAIIILILITLAVNWNVSSLNDDKTYREFVWDFKNNRKIRCFNVKK